MRPSCRNILKIPSKKLRITKGEQDIATIIVAISKMNKGSAAESIIRDLLNKKTEITIHDAADALGLSITDSAARRAIQRLFKNLINNHHLEAKGSARARRYRKSASPENLKKSSFTTLSRDQSKPEENREPPHIGQPKNKLNNIYKAVETFGQMNNPILQIKLGDREVQAPTFFPSVSSIKCNLQPHEYVSILRSLSTLNAQFLVSAFDLVGANDPSNRILQEQIDLARRAGVTVLMDSGNYESYWKNAKLIWTREHFHRALENFPADLAFSFDEQLPSLDHLAHVKTAIKHYLRDQEAAGGTIVIPILHEAPSNLPTVCDLFAKETNVSMLAVAERRLGESIFERIETIKKIRARLNSSGRPVGLHLLGTGNPISIALYSEAGANSFDGLEWCQTAVDHKSGLLFHFAQAGLFLDQTSWGSGDQPYVLKVLAHNLTFYSEWMNDLRESLAQGNSAAFFARRLPREIFEKFEPIFGWRTK